MGREGAPASVATDRGRGPTGWSRTCPSVRASSMAAIDATSDTICARLTGNAGSDGATRSGRDHPLRSARLTTVSDPLRGAGCARPTGRRPARRGLSPVQCAASTGAHALASRAAGATSTGSGGALTAIRSTWRQLAIATSPTVDESTSAVGCARNTGSAGTPPVTRSVYCPGSRGRRGPLPRAASTGASAGGRPGRAGASCTSSDGATPGTRCIRAGLSCPIGMMCFPTALAPSR